MRKTNKTRSRGTGAAISRRRALLTGAAVASAASWPLILTPGKAKASEQVVVPSWGGRYEETLIEAFYKPFEQETGIPVVVGPQPDLGKIKAMAKTGEMEYDFLDLITGWVVEGEQVGLWEPVDTSIVNRSDVIPLANRELVQGFYIAGSGIGYSEERHGQPGQRPGSWQEFWDVQAFPGRRGLRADRIAEMLEVALMADGVPPSEIYPCDVERGFASLERIKPDITHWISSTAQTISLIEKNESDFNYTYNGRVFSSRRAGNPVNFVYNQVFVSVCNCAVLRGARNKEAAMKLMDFYLRPDRQGAWANLYGYMGTNTKCGEFILPETRTEMIDIDSPTNCWENIDWWGPRNAELLKRYKEWLLT